MDESHKYISMGVGGIIGGIVIIIMLSAHLFPKYNIKKAKVISVLSLVVGIILIAFGIIKE